MNTKFDSWLTSQPNDEVWLVTKPDYDEFQDNYESYPFDELVCRDCNEGVGFWLTNENSASWTDYWHLEAHDEIVCVDCMNELNSCIP